MQSRHVLQNSTTIVHLILFHPNVFSCNSPRMVCCRAWGEDILGNESLQQKFYNYNRFYAKWHLMTAIALLPLVARLTIWLGGTDARCFLEHRGFPKPQILRLFMVAPDIGTLHNSNLKPIPRRRATSLKSIKPLLLKMYFPSAYP